MGYKAVCECKDKKSMQAAFEKLLEDCVQKFGGTKDGHRQRQLENVGYFSGYYSQAKMDEVKAWLGAKHPIFGRAIEYTR